MRGVDWRELRAKRKRLLFFFQKICRQIQNYLRRIKYTFSPRRRFSFPYPAPISRISTRLYFRVYKISRASLGRIRASADVGEITMLVNSDMLYSTKRGFDVWVEAHPRERSFWGKRCNCSGRAVMQVARLSWLRASCSALSGCDEVDDGEFRWFVMELERFMMVNFDVRGKTFRVQNKCF